MDSPATTPLPSPIQSTLESPAPTKISWFVWVIIILVLAFLGFNIFTYLAKGTQGVSNFFGHMIENTGIFIRSRNRCDRSAPDFDLIPKSANNVNVATRICEELANRRPFLPRRSIVQSPLGSVHCDSPASARAAYGESLRYAAKAF